MNGKKMKFNLKNIIVVIILAAIILAFYFSTSHPKNSGGFARTSEYDKIMAKDLDIAYPATPKEVVRFYSRIVKLLYNNKLSDKKIENLTERLREVFDEELIEQNPINTHLEQLESDIKAYRKEGKTIVNYLADENDSVEYNTLDNVEYATILADYSLKVGAKHEKSTEKFLLRKDKKGNWKIVGWSLEKREQANKEE